MDNYKLTVVTVVFLERMYNQVNFTESFEIVFEHFCLEKIYLSFLLKVVKIMRLIWDRLENFRKLRTVLVNFLHNT